ncbi:MAG: biotin/lipoate A/B protein ligase family protein [Betaproteobacteria bacterium]
MNWFYIDSGTNIGAYNMAVDEELLARAQAGENIPVLRLYAWRPPAVSLGRFQKIDEAVNVDACKKLGFDIIRRITGGRAVLHRNELTYSIVSRTDNPLFPPSVHGTYKIIAAGLLAGLRNLGIPAEMVSRGGRHAHLVNEKDANPACFSSPSWYEIVVNGKKIIGSAQRRLSGAFLQHGSILISYDPVLEAEIIPGSSSTCRVTSITQELGTKVSLPEIKNAILSGFSRELGISLRSKGADTKE